MTPGSIFGVYRIGAYLWAGPWTLVGLLVGGLSLLSGGSLRRHGGVLEFAGGMLVPLLHRVPIMGGAIAMTLGHVVIGISHAALDRCRAHERVHVRQYERWGPLFVPAYLACSFLEWLRGGHPYLDNPFECQARDDSWE